MKRDRWILVAALCVTAACKAETEDEQGLRQWRESIHQTPTPMHLSYEIFECRAPRKGYTADDVRYCDEVAGLVLDQKIDYVAHPMECAAAREAVARLHPGERTADRDRVVAQCCGGDDARHCIESAGQMTHPEMGPLKKR